MRIGQKEYERVNMKTYMRRVFGIYKGESSRVVMEFDNNLLDTVVDRLGADDIIYHSEGKDRFVVNAEIEVSPQFYAWVFGLGKGAKIISPVSAVEGMKKHLAEVTAAYK